MLYSIGCCLFNWFKLSYTEYNFLKTNIYNNFKLLVKASKSNENYYIQNFYSLLNLNSKFFFSISEFDDKTTAFILK